MEDYNFQKLSVGNTIQDLTESVAKTKIDFLLLDTNIYGIESIIDNVSIPLVIFYLTEGEIQNYSKKENILLINKPIQYSKLHSKLVNFLNYRL